MRFRFLIGGRAAAARNTVTFQGATYVFQHFVSTPTANRPVSIQCGLIDAAGFTGVARSDTFASHPGWEEFTGYAGGRYSLPIVARGAAQPLASSYELLAFSRLITSSGSVRGAFLAYDGGETLFSVAGLKKPLAVSAGQVLSVFYTIADATHPEG